LSICLIFPKNLKALPTSVLIWDWRNCHVWFPEGKAELPRHGIESRKMPETIKYHP
jgi:hypothetical protein